MTALPSHHEKIQPAMEPTVPEYLRELGLGDATLFGVDVENAVAEHAGNFAVAIIDGEGIKKANRLGRKNGDDIIKAIGYGIQANIRTTVLDDVAVEERSEVDNEDDMPTDSAYHLSGDEFAAILYGISDHSKLADWIFRFGQAMEDDGVKVYPGTALHTPGKSGAAVTAEADAAMQDIKTVYKLMGLDARQRNLIREIAIKLTALDIDVENLPTFIEALGSQAPEDLE